MATTPNAQITNTGMASDLSNPNGSETSDRVSPVQLGGYSVSTSTTPPVAAPHTMSGPSGPQHVSGSSIGPSRPSSPAVQLSTPPAAASANIPTAPISVSPIANTATSLPSATPGTTPGVVPLLDTSPASSLPVSAPAKPWKRIVQSRRTRVFRDCKYLLLAIGVYILALSIAATVSFKYTLLGVVPFGAGIFFLNLISKGGDIAFALAVGEAFENLLWGRLAEKKTLPMRDLLALDTSTGAHGLWSMIRPSMKKSREMKSSRYWALLQYVVSGGSFDRRVADLHSLTAIVILPGPGLLLMASVNPELYYFSTTVFILDTTINGTFEVSAGIAAYQPAAAATSLDAARIRVPLLVQNMLQDTTKSLPADAVSDACRAVESNCTSTILSGGLQNVKPWPNFRAETSAKFMIIDNVPSYQFDVWSFDATGFQADNALCEVYGFTDPRFELCINDGSGKHGELQVCKLFQRAAIEN